MYGLYKIVSKMFKVLHKLKKMWYKYHSTLTPSGKCYEKQPVLFLGKGKVILGEGNMFGYYPSPYLFNGYCHIEARHEDAVIRIGNSNHFNNNFTIIAEHGGITIGNGCLVGTNVSIINSDFHPISIARRHLGTQKSKEVIIGNNVWLGNNVSICKGVHIGENAIVVNGAVVFDDVAPNTIVRGNPAVFFKEIYE